MFELLFKYPQTAYAKGNLVFQSGWPLWVWAVGTLVAGGLVFWFLLAKLQLANRQRALVLGGLQTLGISLALLLLWQPGLSVSTLKPQQNVVAIVVDRSTSMALSEEGTQRMAAAKQLALERLGPALGDRFQVRYYTVGKALERTQDLAKVTADGPVTRLNGGLRQLANETASLPLGAVVVLSDGGDSSGGVDRETLQLFQSRRLPVHTVGFGQVQAATDVELVDVQLPARAIPDSRLIAQVQLRNAGLAGQKMKLSLQDGTRVLAQREIALAQAGQLQTETLLFNSGAAGVRSLTVTAKPLANETNQNNNALNRMVQVDDRKLRILYLEGEPRWEFKFIRRALELDKSLDIVTVLRTTQNKFYRQGIQNPNELEEGFPLRGEELFPYAAVIVGTVEAGYFSAAQNELLTNFVDRRGGGLLFTAGRTSFADGAYGASPLAALMPFTVGDRRTTFSRDVAKVELTAAGRQNVHARLEDDPAKNAERWKKLPEIADYQKVGAVKPGATVFAEAITKGGRTPLWIHQNYGRGRVDVLATSGTWRWQMLQTLEDTSHETFWQQLLRSLAVASPGPVSSAMDRTLYSDETRVKLRVDVRNKMYQPLADATVEARLTGPNGTGAVVTMEPDKAEAGIYTAEYEAKEPGSYLAEFVATRGKEELGRDRMSFRREDGAAEAFHTQQNQTLLQSLAKETGGKYWSPENAADLAKEVTYSEGGIQSREILAIWNMPAVFLLFVLLRGAEWLLRRKWGTV